MLEPGSVPTRAQREAIRGVTRAADAASDAREMQRNAVRQPAETGIPLDLLAHEAEMAPAEVRRVTERVPVT